MKNQALISVIIPVYNVEDYLRECIDSVITQTYTNLEIILVNDGSTDSSGKICDEYVEKDERVTVIHQKNGGLSAARNAGFFDASGKYIYFLDSDDYIAENTIEILVAIAEKEHSDIVFFDAVSFADSNDFTVSQNYIRKNKYKTDNGYSVFSLMTANKEYHSAVYLMLLSKSFLDEFDLTFVPGILHEDMIYTYQILCKASVVSQCDKALYYRRYRKNSIMTSAKSVKHFTSIISVCKFNTEFTNTLEQFDLNAANQYLSRCAFNVFNVYEMLNRNDKKTCRTELSEFKKFIIGHKAFGNTALRIRCYGKVFWFIYKIFEKSAGILLKGKK